MNNFQIFIKSLLFLLVFSCKPAPEKAAPVNVQDKERPIVSAILEDPDAAPHAVSRLMLPAARSSGAIRVM